MRRTKKKLQVDTFPFLAVLLCAMGSLILLLLVMDRRAKIVARNKVVSARAQKSTELSDHLAALQAVVNAQNDALHADQQESHKKKRQAILDELLAQDREVQAQLSRLRSEALRQEKLAEDKQSQSLKTQEAIQAELQKLLTQRQHLDLVRQELMKGDKTQTAMQMEQSRLAQELDQLERTLKELKLMKNRETNVYSLVPFKGKRGDARKPTYVECSEGTFVFHPERKVMFGDIQPILFRDELQKRTGPISLDRTDRGKAGNSNEPRPYVLFLVRPSGIGGYYWAQEVLKGWAVDFGYELVEPDWVFDFSEENQQIASAPWRVESPKVGAPAPGGSKMVPGSKMGLPGKIGSSQGDTGFGEPGQGGYEQGGTGNGPGTGNVGSGYPQPPGVGGYGASNGPPGSGAGSKVALGSPSGIPGNGSGTFGPGGTGTNGAGTGGPGNGFGPYPPGSDMGPTGGVPGGTATGPGGKGPPSTGLGTTPNLIGSGGYPGTGGGNQPGGNYPGPNGVKLENPVAMNSPGVIGQPGSGYPGSGGQANSLGQSPNIDTGNAAGQPGGGQPNAGNPGTGNYPGSNGSGYPGTGRPDNGQPGMAAPNGVGSSGSGSINNGFSGSGQPGSGQPGSGNPGAGSSSGANDPGQPGSGQPGSGQPGSGQAGGSGTMTVMKPGQQPNPNQRPSRPRNENDPPPQTAGEGGTGSSEPGEGDPNGSSGTPSNDPPLPKLLQGLPSTKKGPAPRPVSLSRLTGNRDFFIVIECNADGAYLVLRDELFPTRLVTAQREVEQALAAAVKNLIDRRQATVREGETPYRPQIRLKVHPDGLRAYYWVYPALLSLRVPMTRENLDE